MRRARLKIRQGQSLINEIELDWSPVREENARKLLELDHTTT